SLRQRRALVRRWPVPAWRIVPGILFAATTRCAETLSRQRQIQREVETQSHGSDVVSDSRATEERAVLETPGKRWSSATEEDYRETINVAPTPSRAAVAQAF